MSVASSIPERRSKGIGTALVGFLVGLSIVATAFNDIPPMLPIGELSEDLFVYAFPVLALAMLCQPIAVEIPRTFLIFAAALLGIVLLGVMVNFHEISFALFKGRTGQTRVVTQSMSMCLGLLVILVFYNVVRRGMAFAIAKGAFWAMAVMAFVGLCEVGDWYGLPGLSQLHAAMGAVIHAESGMVYAERLRATAFEVSWMAVMLTFLFPFALAGVSDRRRTLGICAILGTALVMTVLAQSRTAMMVMLLQIMLFGFILLRRRMDLIAHMATLAVLGLMALFLIPGVASDVTKAIANLVEYGSMAGNVNGSGNTQDNVSNLTRFASVKAGTQIFLDNPLLGVGIGQFGFYYPDYISAADLLSWEVARYLIIDPEYLWPPAYSLHVRLLAETGIFGYLTWLIPVLVMMLRAIARAGVETRTGRLYLAVAMVLMGWLMLGISIDSFRFFGGWIAIGVMMALDQGHAEQAAFARKR